MKKITTLIAINLLLLSGCSTNLSSQNPVQKTVTTTHTLEQTQQQKPTQQIQATTQTVPIIMFHYVRHVDKAKDPLGYNLSIEADTFDKILQYLKENNYNTIHAKELLKGSVPERSIILSFDDGYIDFYTTAWPLLKKYGFTATEAVITGKMDGKQYMTPENVKTIDQAGIEIFSHTVHHTNLDKDTKQKNEVEASKAYLEKLLGKPVIGLVYPAGHYNNQTIDYLKNADYKIAFTTKPGYADLTNDLFQLHRIRIDNRDGLNGFIKKLKN